MTELLEGVDPRALEEFRNIPHINCKSCGKILGHLRDPFLSRTQSGINPKTAFEQLGVIRYCCRQSISHPGKLAPGLIYNNPRQRKRIVSEEAAVLLGKLSIRGESYRPVDVSALHDITGGLRTTIGPEPPKKPLGDLSELIPSQPPIAEQRVISTAIIPGMSVARTDQQPSDAFDPEEPETNEITAQHLPPDFEKRIRAREIGGQPRITVSSSIIGGRIPFEPSPPVAPPVAVAVAVAGAESIMDDDLPIGVPGLEGLPSVPIVGPPAKEIPSAMTGSVFLPRIIKVPDPTRPGEMTIIRQYSGV